MSFSCVGLILFIGNVLIVEVGEFSYDDVWLTMAYYVRDFVYEYYPL